MKTCNASDAIIFWIIHILDATGTYTSWLLSQPTTFYVSLIFKNSRDKNTKKSVFEEYGILICKIQSFYSNFQYTC